MDSVPPFPYVEYFHVPHSPWCQMVLFCLYEKKVAFFKYYVDIYHPENIDPRLLNLSRTGHLPLMQIDGNCIVDVAAAMEHLETTFVNGLYPSLVPDDRTHEMNLYVYFKDVLKSVSPLSLVFIPLVKSKLPSKIRRDLNVEFKYRLQFIFKFVPDQSPEHLKILEPLQQAAEAGFDPGHLNRIVLLLSEMERMITYFELNMWLCGPHITYVDIEFGIFLHQLEFLSLSQRYLRMFPNVADYFERMKRHEGYIKTISVKSDLKRKSRRPPQKSPKLTCCQYFSRCCVIVFIIVLISNIAAYWIGS